MASLNRSNSLATAGRLITGLSLAITAFYAPAQETTASAQASPLATIHQFGILRSSSQPIPEADLLELPDFVHTASPTAAITHTWLDFSALYVIPPQMMSGPLTLQVQQEMISGLANVTAWYPYRAPSSTANNRTCKWTDVLAGVQADGLETKHPVWMTARAMEAAATLKVYKPGPPGTRPDDLGTTEGDVYLFMRGQADGLAPLVATLDPVRSEWVISPLSLWSDVAHYITSDTQHAWIARATDAQEIASRRIILGADPKDSATRTTATVEQEPYSRATADIRWQLNEALAGNGLRSDEAAAEANLIIKSLQKMKKPALVYLLPSDWTNARFRLAVRGPTEKPVRVFVAILELPTAP